MWHGASKCELQVLPKFQFNAALELYQSTRYRSTVCVAVLESGMHASLRHSVQVRHHSNPLTVADLSIICEPDVEPRRRCGIIIQQHVWQMQANS